jgi:ABC-type nitrate/sulfonate/bicarbonate transport system substrate-binding protein
MNRGMLAVVIAGLAAFSGAQQAVADTSLRVGQVPSTMKAIGIVPFVIAQNQGFFAREHLAVENVPLAGGTDQMVKRLEAGDVEISSSATPYFIEAVAKGTAHAVAVAAATANPIYSLVVKPDIKSFADLKGKTLGLSLGIDTISISMRKLLAMKGLKESEYTVKELVGTPVRFACLKDSECDGVPLGQPDDLVALDQGFRRLGVSTEAIKHFEFTVLIVRPDWARANRASLIGFLRGYAAALRFFRDPKERETVVKTITETTGVSDKIARATLALYFEPDRGVIPKAGELDLQGLKQVIAFMGAAGVLKFRCRRPRASSIEAICTRPG